MALAAPARATATSSCGSRLRNRFNRRSLRKCGRNATGAEAREHVEARIKARVRELETESERRAQTWARAYVEKHSPDLKVAPTETDPRAFRAPKWKLE